jgi:hypothetical protein
MILKGIRREGMNGVCRTFLAASLCQHADQESSSMAMLQMGSFNSYPSAKKGKGQPRCHQCESVSLSCGTTSFVNPKISASLAH